MPISTAVAGTPKYVLMEGNRPIGPDVVPFDLGRDCLPVYGFSNPGAYDKFRSSANRPLIPYPLVKVYLRMQAGAAGDGLKLVVLDAAGPRKSPLCAATMDAVLKAQETGERQVTAEYRLTFDQEAGAYRLEEVTRCVTQA